MTHKVRHVATNVHPSLTPAARVRFAHPSERIFASLMDFYEITWEYEPVEFAIDWDESGFAVSAFRPDFWLPEHRCFVELTTAEQRLVTRKNAKVRRFRELFPELEIVVVYQKEFFSLMQSHGLNAAVLNAA